MRVECWKLFDKSGPTSRGVKLQKYKISWKRAKKSTTQSTTDGKAVVSNFERAKHRLRTMTERYGFSFFKIAWISRHDANSRQPTDWQSIERTFMHGYMYIYIYVYLKELLSFIRLFVSTCHTWGAYNSRALRSASSAIATFWCPQSLRLSLRTLSRHVRFPNSKQRTRQDKTRQDKTRRKSSSSSSRSRSSGSVA